MDMFDLDDAHLGTEQADEPKPAAPKPTKPTASQEGQEGGGRYIIQNIVAMFPGWLACYDDPEAPDQVIMFPIVALAMVLLQHPDGATEQTVRQLVSTSAGQIDDITQFPNFICVIAPGQSPNAIVPAMRQMRANAAS